MTSQRDAVRADRDRAIEDIDVERDKTQRFREAVRRERKRVSAVEDEATTRALQAAGDALYRTMHVINPDMDVQQWPLYQALAAGDRLVLERITLAVEGQSAAAVRSEPAPAPRSSRGRDGGGRER